MSRDERDEDKDDRSPAEALATNWLVGNRSDVTAELAAMTPLGAIALIVEAADEVPTMQRRLEFLQAVARYIRATT